MRSAKIMLLFTLCLASVKLLAQDLQNYQWKNRLLLVLTKEAAQEQFQKQLQILQSDKQGLQERKLLIFPLLKDEPEDAALYQRYQKKQRPFEVLLIGLDGGVKLRQDTLLSLEELYARIDGMPMRRAELENQN